MYHKSVVVALKDEMYFPLWKFLEVDHDCNDAAEGPVLHIRNTGIIWACVRIAELGSSITSVSYVSIFFGPSYLEVLAG